MDNRGPYAFVDEYGDANLNTELNGTTGAFVVTAVVVDSTNLDRLGTELEAIRKKHFQTGEIKSSGVGADDGRRERILFELCRLPFTFASVVIDKDEINRESGLQYKTSFIKYINGLLYRRLFSAYPTLVAYADEHGRTEFMNGFAKYVEAHHKPMLFSQHAEFYFATWETQPILQLADFISGTLARYYDPKKWTERAPGFLGLLRDRAMVVDEWPPRHLGTPMGVLPGEHVHDALVRSVCYDAALVGLERFKNVAESPEIWQRDVLARIVTHFRWISEYEYVPTEKLTSVIGKPKEDGDSRFFRSEIIAPLRDAGVILAASPQGGYKIPANRTDLQSFVKHADRIVGPMLDRLASARSAMMMASTNQLDIVSADEFAYLRDLLDKRRIGALTRPEPGQES